MNGRKHRVVTRNETTSSTGTSLRKTQWGVGRSQWSSYTMLFYGLHKRCEADFYGKKGWGDPASEFFGAQGNYGPRHSLRKFLAELVEFAISESKGEYNIPLFQVQRQSHFGQYKGCPDLKNCIYHRNLRASSCNYLKMQKPQFDITRSVQI